MARIVELRTRQDRFKAEQAALLRDALAPLQHELPDAYRAVVGYIDRQTCSRNRWTFVMLSPAQNALVVNYLVSSSERPLVAVRLWALCFEHLDVETGEILLRRDQIADLLGQRSAEVSSLMAELVECGAVLRHQEPVAGVRGRGYVRYYMNSRVATHLSGAERDAAQKSSPQLRIVKSDKKSLDKTTKSGGGGVAALSACLAVVGTLAHLLRIYIVSRS
jgi:predicted transcriptional regulator